MHPMKKTIILGLGVAGLLLALPQTASAQISIGLGASIDIAFPEPPPLVVVRPGVQIVPEYEEEVYFVGGYYWVLRDDSWYRSSTWRGGHWRPVRYRYVPASLARIPPGRYRYYYRDDDGRWRPHHHDDWRSWRERNDAAQRRVWWREHRRDRMIRHEQERAWRERQREDRELERAQWQRWKGERRDRERAERERAQVERRERRHDGPPPGGGDRRGGGDHGGPGKRHHGP